MERKERIKNKDKKKIRKFICLFLKLGVVKYIVCLYLCLNVVNILLNCIKNYG